MGLYEHPEGSREAYWTDLDKKHARYAPYYSEEASKSRTGLPVVNPNSPFGKWLAGEKKPRGKSSFRIQDTLGATAATAVSLCGTGMIYDHFDDGNVLVASVLSSPFFVAAALSGLVAAMTIYDQNETRRENKVFSTASEHYKAIKVTKLFDQIKELATSKDSELSPEEIETIADNVISKNPELAAILEDDFQAPEEAKVPPEYRELALSELTNLVEDELTLIELKRFEGDYAALETRHKKDRDKAHKEASKQAAKEMADAKRLNKFAAESAARAARICMALGTDTKTVEANAELSRLLDPAPKAEET